MRKILPYILLIILLISAMLLAYKNGGEGSLAEKGLEKKGVIMKDFPLSDDQKAKNKTTSEFISVTEPLPGAVIVSPLVINGQARGAWYFEAVFPVELVDMQGNLVTSTQATAIGDWMTDDFVKFEATLNFQPGPAKKGKLILRKDNPSGEKILDDYLEIAVTY